MGNKLIMGVIGLGHMGTTHFYNALRHPQVKVNAVADPLKKNQKKAKKYKIPNIYNDYRELLEKEKNLDAVIISLPNFLHKDAILNSFEHDVNVLVDKPLAITPKDANEIANATKKSGKRVMVNTNFRYFPHVQKLKQQLEEGRYGDIIIATIEHIMHGPFSHPLYPRPVAEWWFSREKVGGGALMDNGHHVIDLFNWLFPDAEVKFSSLGYHYNLEIEDYANVLLKSKKTGTEGVLNTGWFSHILFPKLDFRIIVHGTNGYQSTDELIPNLYVHAAKTSIKNTVKRMFFRRITPFEYTYFYVSYYKILDEFVKGLRNDEEFPVTIEQQLKVISLIDQIYKSHGKR